MDFNLYQEQAKCTALYPRNMGLVYTALGLAGEAGEYANKVKKVIRDSGGAVAPEQRAKMIEELGDVLWYVAMAAHEMDETLDVVAAGNLAKLRDRAKRAAIKGEGDTR